TGGSETEIFSQQLKNSPSRDLRPRELLDAGRPGPEHPADQRRDDRPEEDGVGPGVEALYPLALGLVGSVIGAMASGSIHSGAEVVAWAISGIMAGGTARSIRNVKGR